MSNIVNNPQNYTDVLLVQAIQVQSQIGLKALAKGFIVTNWEQVQEGWSKTSDNTHDSAKWTRGVITALQIFTQEMWLTRNDILHGKTVAEQNEITKSKCRERIKYMYAQSRKNLTLREKEMFKLPVRLRQKRTAEGRRIWIEQAEMIFQEKDKDTNNKLDIKD